MIFAGIKSPGKSMSVSLLSSAATLRFVFAEVD
jgi:hypothetical protein